MCGLTEALLRKCHGSKDLNEVLRKEATKNSAENDFQK